MGELIIKNEMFSNITMFALSIMKSLPSFCNFACLSGFQRVNQDGIGVVIVHYIEVFVTSGRGKWEATCKIFIGEFFWCKRQNF